MKKTRTCKVPRGSCERGNQSLGLGKEWDIYIYFRSIVGRYLEKFQRPPLIHVIEREIALCISLSLCCLVAF